MDIKKFLIALGLTLGISVTLVGIISGIVWLIEHYPMVLGIILCMILFFSLVYIVYSYL
jgi:hypothetical protein